MPVINDKKKLLSTACQVMGRSTISGIIAASNEQVVIAANNCVASHVKWDEKKVWNYFKFEDGSELNLIVAQEK